MEHLLRWNPDDWTSHETYEDMLTAVGGAELATLNAEATRARKTFESLLTPGQREPYGEASDAAAEASHSRESAATRVALAHGIAIGAALTAFPSEPADRLLQAGAALTSELLASGLTPTAALALNRTVLDALNRAEAVAALPGRAADPPRE